MSEGVTEQGRGGATIVLLEDVTLTASYAGNESEPYNVSPCSQIELGLDYTMDGAETANTAEVAIFFSEDGDNYHEYTIASDSNPSGNVVTTTLYNRRLQIAGTAGVAEKRWFAIPTSAKYFKIQAKETGVASNYGTLRAIARVSNDETYP